MIKLLIPCILASLLASSLYADDGCDSKLDVQSAVFDIAKLYSESARNQAPRDFIQNIDPSIIERSLTEVARQVDELNFIRDFAEKKGARVWLLGGSATAVADYRRGQILRLLGDADFQSERFIMPHFANIFRSIQDLDVVIDAKPAVAEELERLLKEKYPYLRTDKNIWEVRLLRENRADKMPLLNNPDFINSHNDSLSIWMLELTTPAQGEHAIRDLHNWDHDWKTGMPDPMKDLWQGKISYIYSMSHEETERASLGLNPPILSVVRYFTKLFQYGLEPAEGDVQTAKDILEHYNMKEDLGRPYGAHLPYPYRWLRWASKKLLKGPTNLEEAANLMDSIGLRRIIRKIEPIGPTSKAHTAGWWISKEPLRSFPLGTILTDDPRFRLVDKQLHVGQKASQLGLTRVVRRIKLENYVHYELLKFGVPGMANVFVDRKSADGETAGFVDGFLTSVDGTMSKKPGLYIDVAFDLNPDARAGADFLRKGNEVVVLNKNAIQVVPQSLQWNIQHYFETALHNPEEFMGADKSFLTRVRADLAVFLKYPGTENLQSQLLRYLSQELQDTPNSLRVSLEMARIAPQLIEPADVIKMMSAQNIPTELLEALALNVFSDPRWAFRSGGPESVKAVINQTVTDPEISLRYLVKHALSHNEWLEIAQADQLAVDIVARDNHKADRGVARYILGSPQWWVKFPKKMEAVFLTLLERPDLETHKRLQGLTKKLEGQIPAGLFKFIKEHLEHHEEAVTLLDEFSGFED